MWHKFLNWFNSLPGPVQIAIYSVGSALLTLLGKDLASGTWSDWRAYLLIPVMAGVNIIGWLILNKKAVPTDDK